MKIHLLHNSNMPKRERDRINRVVKAINRANLTMVEHRMLLVTINQTHLEDDWQATFNHFVELLKLNGIPASITPPPIGEGDN